MINNIGLLLQLYRKLRNVCANPEKSPTAEHGDFTH